MDYEDTGMWGITDKIWARLSDQGTAMAETALCDDHVESYLALVDCSLNDALSCVVCGKITDC